MKNETADGEGRTEANLFWKYKGKEVKDKGKEVDPSSQGVVLSTQRVFV